MWSGALASVALVLAFAAPEPPTGPCDWDDSVMTEFDVADRAEIVQRIPDLGRAPEVTGEATILENGRPAGLARDPLHVKVIRCVRSDQLPILGQVIRDGRRPLPHDIWGVVAITNATGDSTIYSGVSLDGLTGD
jgi:hypothetical protein